MALQMIYGRANSGKTQFILNKAKEFFENDEPFIIVVPEQFTHIAERRLIKKIGSIQSKTAEVLSFDRIARRIFDMYPSDKKIIGSVGKSLIMSKIISECELEYYKGCNDQIGFSNVCVDEISMLKKYNISPNDLKKAAESAKELSLKYKFGDISEIYEKYNNELKNTFNDSDDLLNILDSVLQNVRPYEGITFIFDEFSSFNPQEINIISSLASQAKNIYMTLSCDTSNDKGMVFRPTEQCSKKIKSACKRYNVEIKDTIFINKTYYNRDEISFLEKNLYSYPPQKTNIECDSIRIYAYENPYTEVIQTASKIIALVREKNIRYREISVVCSDVPSYSNIIRSVFSMFSIPCFIDEKTDVLNHSIINFVINIFDVYLKGYDSETVVNFLKSGYLNITPDEVYASDNFIAATGATKNTWLSDDRWEKTLDFYCGDNIENKSLLNNVRNKYIMPLAVLHDKIKGKKAVKYICEQIYDYLLNSEFDKSICSYIEHFKSERNNYMAKQYSYVWKTLIEALDMLVFVFGDKSVNLKEFKKYLFIAFSQQKIGIIPTSVDEIIVGDVLRSKSEPVKYQFVIGACDSSFPSPKNNNTFIDDTDKSFLNSIGIGYSPNSEEASYYDRFLIYSALAHPTDALIISYPMADTSFSRLRPSFVVTLIENMFPKLHVGDSTSEKAESCFTNINIALEFLVENIRKITNGESADKRWQDIYHYLYLHNRDDAIKFISDSIKSKKRITKLSSELTNRLFDKEFYSTISRIQKYNSCRYSYYLRYMLSLKPKDAFGFESVDIGTLAHEIIEKIFKKISYENIDLKNVDEAFFKTNVDILTDKFIDDVFSESAEFTKRDIAEIEELRKSLVLSLVMIKNHIVRSKFVPMGYEMIFDDNNIGCIELNLNNGKKLKLTGKIDRADSFTNEDGTYIRVVDYKTGNKKFDYSDVFYGLDIQILIYLDALVEKNPNAKHAGALYFKIGNSFLDTDTSDDITDEDIDKSFKMIGVVADEKNVLNAFDPLSINMKGSGANNISLGKFKLLSDYVKDEAAKSASDLSSGFIDVNPYVKSEKKPCDYCEYSAVCGFSDENNDVYRTLKSVNKTSIWKNINDNTNGGENNELDK